MEREKLRKADFGIWGAKNFVRTERQTHRQN